MFAKLKAKWLYFWHHSVQKTTGWIITVALSFDLAGYAEPAKALVGPKAYYSVVIAAALINTARAHTAKVPEVLPPPTVPPRT